MAAYVILNYVTFSRTRYHMSALLNADVTLDDGPYSTMLTHHQSVRQIGEGLRKCAASPDGVIEAIESADTNWFCIGVQWHPESESASALDMQLFECFVQACLRASQPLELAA